MSRPRPVLLTLLFSSDLTSTTRDSTTFRDAFDTITSGTVHRQHCVLTTSIDTILQTMLHVDTILLQQALPRIRPVLQGYCLPPILLLRLQRFALAFDTSNAYKNTAPPVVCFVDVQYYDTIRYDTVR